MDLDMIIGFIAGLGLATGVRVIMEDSKKRGIVQLILTFLVPILTSLFCLKKKQFVFGGTDWEFLIQTATVDKMIEPWLLLIMYIILIFLIIYNMYSLIKKRKSNK